MALEKVVVSNLRFVCWRKSGLGQFQSCDVKLSDMVIVKCMHVVYECWGWSRIRVVLIWFGLLGSSSLACLSLQSLLD